MRDELIKKLQWNNGGMSYGVASVGNFFAVVLSKKTLPSSVVVSTPHTDYTDDELRELVDFSEEATKQHNKVCGEVRVSDNLICVSKIGEQWCVKRVSWDHAQYRPTFTEVRQLMIR